MMEFKVVEFMQDKNCRLSQFSPSQIAALEERVFLKNDVYYVQCLKRGRDIRLTREEVIRQLYLIVLMDALSYPKDRIEIEYPVYFGREKKRADICVFDQDRKTDPYIVIEVKKPKLADGKEQLKSYCAATGAPIAVWTNGDSISYYHRKDPNHFEDIASIPNAHQKLSDILNERWTIDDLIQKDKLVTEKKSLKDIIRRRSAK